MRQDELVSEMRKIQDRAGWVLNAQILLEKIYGGKLKISNLGWIGPALLV